MLLIKNILIISFGFTVRFDDKDKKFAFFSEIMSLKREEMRIRDIVQKLVPVCDPENHGRAKWDKQSSKDLIEVIQTLGNLFSHSILGL